MQRYKGRGEYNYSLYFNCYGLVCSRLVANFPPLAAPARTVQYGLENYFEGRVFLPRAVLLSWWPLVVRLCMALDCFSRGSGAEETCNCWLVSAETYSCP